MELETKCPQCGSNIVKDASELNLDRVVTCVKCGHAAKLSDFLTADARQRVLKAYQEAAIKAFSNMPGFKK